MRTRSGCGRKPSSSPYSIEWTDANGKLNASQLFDEDKDPAETRNLANHPAHAATVRQLAARRSKRLGHMRKDLL